MLIPDNFFLQNFKHLFITLVTFVCACVFICFGLTTSVSVPMWVNSQPLVRQSNVWIPGRVVFKALSCNREGREFDSVVLYCEEPSDV